MKKHEINTDNVIINEDANPHEQEYQSIAEAMLGNKRAEKYRGEITCKQAEMYLFLNRHDKSLKGLAEHLNVSVSTIYNWLADKPEFNKSVMQFVFNVKHNLMSALIKSGTGYYNSKGDWIINDKIAFALARHYELGLEEQSGNNTPNIQVVIDNQVFEPEIIKPEVEVITQEMKDKIRAEVLADIEAKNNGSYKYIGDDIELCNNCSFHVKECICNTM